MLHNLMLLRYNTLEHIASILGITTTKQCMIRY